MEQHRCGNSIRGSGGFGLGDSPLAHQKSGQRFQTAQEVADALGQLRNTGSGRLIPLAEPLEVSIQTQNVGSIDDSSEDLTEHEPALAQADPGNSAPGTPKGHPATLGF